MSAVYQTFYLSRWLVFLVRWLLSFVYGILQFISKPGSRYIVPVFLAITIIFQRPWMHQALKPFVVSFLPTAVIIAFVNGLEEGGMSVVERAQRTALNTYYGVHVDWWLLDGFIVVFFILTCIVYSDSFVDFVGGNGRISKTHQTVAADASSRRHEAEYQIGIGAGCGAKTAPLIIQREKPPPLAQ